MLSTLAASLSSTTDERNKKNRIDSLLATMVHQLSLLVTKDQGWTEMCFFYSQSIFQSIGFLSSYYETLNIVIYSSDVSVCVCKSAVCIFRVYV